jgi:hypothetical protein
VDIKKVSPCSSKRRKTDKEPNKKNQINQTKEKKMKLKSEKQFILTVLVGACLLLLLQTHVSAIFSFNYSGCTFTGACSNNATGGAGLDSINDTIPLIDVLIIRGAGNFLKADSEILLFSHKIEMAELNGVDYEELRQIIGNAVSYMEQARDTYLQLVDITASIPYDEAVLRKLISFDYDRFAIETQSGGEAFAEVKGFLGVGDVKGIYTGFLLKVQGILDRMKKIKVSIDAGIFPSVQDTWLLNRACSQAQMVGQLTSEVFYNIN